jgi:hypothetical protein
MQIRVGRQAAVETPKGWLPWQALRRKLDREQPDYRS